MKPFILLCLCTVLLIGCDSNSSDGEVNVQGNIEQIDRTASTLSVEQRDFQVNNTTEIATTTGTELTIQDLQIGDYVAISGLEDETGVLIANSIENDTTQAVVHEACTGVVDMIVDENLIVPEGAICTLQGARIDGNIFIQRGATLTATGIDVEGNIQAEEALSVNVTGQSTVGGNVQIKQGGSASITDTTVDGDVQLESNEGAIAATRTVIGGNLQVNQNTGNVTLTDNQIQQNMQCQANSPAPTGSGNTAGDKEDQCATL